MKRFNPTHLVQDLLAERKLDVARERAVCLLRQGRKRAIARDRNISTRGAHGQQSGQISEMGGPQGRTTSTVDAEARNQCKGSVHVSVTPAAPKKGAIRQPTSSNVPVACDRVDESEERAGQRRSGTG